MCTPYFRGSSARSAARHRRQLTRCARVNNPEIPTLDPGNCVADRFVLYSDRFGVMLGRHPELGHLWSNLETAGQPGAVTFETRQSALYWLQSEGLQVPDVRTVAVTADWGGKTASVGALMRANLPGWIDAQMITANAQPI